MTLNVTSRPSTVDTSNNADTGDIDFAAILARATAAQAATGTPPAVDLDPSPDRTEISLGTTDAGDFNVQELISSIVQNGTGREVPIAPNALSSNAIALNSIDSDMQTLNTAVKELEYSIEKDLGFAKIKISVSIPKQPVFKKDPVTGEMQFDILGVVGSVIDITKAKLKIEIVESPGKDAAGKSIVKPKIQSMKAEYDVSKRVFNLTYVEETNKQEVKTDFFKVSGSIKKGVDAYYYDPSNTNNGAWSIEGGLGVAVKVAGVDNFIAFTGQRLSQWLGQFAWTTVITGAAAGPTAWVTAALAGIASVGVGEFTKGWEGWVGIKFNAKLSVDQGFNPENIFLEVSGNKVSLAQALNGANQAKNELLRGDSFVGQFARIFNILPEPSGPSIDDNLTALHANLDYRTRKNLTELMLRSDLEAGADALSIHGVASEIIWGAAQENRTEMASNASYIQYNDDPRMYIARIFEAAFYSSGQNGRKQDWSTRQTRSSELWFWPNDLQKMDVRTKGAGEYTIRNIPNLLAEARRNSFKNAGVAGQNDFDLRFKAFAENLVDRGYSLDFPGNPDTDIGRLWTSAFNDAKITTIIFSPAPDAAAVSDYFKKGVAGGLSHVRSDQLTDMRARLKNRADRGVSVYVAGVFSQAVQAFQDGATDIQPFTRAIGIALADGATKEQILAAISAEVFGGISTVPNVAEYALPVIENLSLAQRIAAAPALDSPEMVAIRKVLQQSGLDADFARLDDTSTAAFRDLSSEQVMNMALLQAAYVTTPAQVALLKTFDVTTGRTLASAIASIQSGTNAASSADFITAVAQNLERGLGTNDTMLLAISQVLPTRNLIASVRGFASDSNEAVFFAGEKFDKLPDSSKVQFNNDYAGYQTYRAGVNKETATEQQRTAFRDAYIETFARGGTTTAAYNAGKLAADRLDTPLELKSPVKAIQGNEAATVRFKVADLVPAFTSIGKPTYTLSGADAAKFEVVDGVLYLKSGTEIDKTTTSKLDVNIEVSYPESGDKPLVWKGTWPPVGSATLTINMVSQTLVLPEIGGRVKTHTAPAGWNIAGGTPDIIGGNGPWPAGDGDRRDISIDGVTDRSPSGGTMAFLIASPGWNEIISTELTGLVVGQTYELSPVYWQQASSSGGYSVENSPARLLVTVGGQEFKFEPVGSVAGDSWQTANVRFTATATSMIVKLGGQALDPTDSSVIVVDVGPALANQAPIGVEVRNPVTQITANTDLTARRRVADVKPIDDGLGRNTMTLSGRDAALFELVDGSVYLKAGVDLASRAGTNLDFNVVAQDLDLPGSTPATQNLRISVTANKAPTALTLSQASGSIVENTLVQQRRLVSEITIVDDGLGVNTLKLSGADAGLFELVGKQLYIKAGTVIDFETNPVLDVTITVTDPDFADQPGATVDFKLNVTDANDAPTDLNFVNAPPVLNLVSDITVRTQVADVVAVDDALGNNTFTLFGADAEMFELVDGKLFLKADLPINAATKPSLSVTVSVKDTNTDKPAVSKTFTMAVANGNAAPTAVTITPVVTRIVENVPVLIAQEVATIAITDDGVGTNAITLSGADAALFEVVGNKLMLKAGTTVDFEQRSTLNVIVNVDDAGRGDGIDATATYTIQVQDMNDAPTVVNLYNVETVLSRATPLEIPLKVADLVIDSDAIGTERIQLVGADADKFMVVDNKLYLKAGTVLDFTTKPVFQVSILVDDPTLIGSALVRKQFRIDVAPSGGFASVYGKFIFDETGNGEDYILWPDGRQQAVIYSENQRTGEPILTDKLTMARLNYIKAPDGEFYILPRN